LHLSFVGPPKANAAAESGCPCVSVRRSHWRRSLRKYVMHAAFQWRGPEIASFRRRQEGSPSKGGPHANTPQPVDGSALAGSDARICSPRHNWTGEPDALDAMSGNWTLIPVSSAIRSRLRTGPIVIIKPRSETRKGIPPSTLSVRELHDARPFSIPFPPMFRRLPRQVASAGH
jgi:hypothetical protein